MRKNYLEMENIANRLEDLRKALYQNKKHLELQGKEDAQYIDENLFRIEHQLRQLSEYCLAVY